MNYAYMSLFFRESKKIFVLLVILSGTMFFSHNVFTATQACKINSVCYKIGDDVPNINGVQGVGKIDSSWLETFCSPPLQEPFETLQACQAGGITYPNGGCRCGNQCIKYGNSAAGGSIMTPGNCGACTEYTNFQKCVDEVARGNTSSTQLSKYANQLNKLEADTLPELIGVLIKGVMGVVGTVALVMMLYGGITWMTARGNSESTQKARDTILWAGLGIVLIFASYALVNFIFEIFR